MAARHSYDFAIFGPHVPLVTLHVQNLSVGSVAEQPCDELQEGTVHPLLVRQSTQVKDAEVAYQVFASTHSM